MFKSLKYKFIIIIITLLIVMFSSAIYSQTNIPQSSKNATIKINNQDIIELKSSLDNLSPQERAVQISNKLKNKLLYNQININNIELSQLNNQYLIYLKDNLFTLTKEDLDINGKDPNNFIKEFKNDLQKLKKTIPQSNLLYTCVFYGMIFILIFSPIIKFSFSQTITKIDRILIKIFWNLKRYKLRSKLFKFLKSIWNPTKHKLRPNKTEEISPSNKVNNESDQKKTSIWDSENIEKVKQKFKVGGIDDEGRQIIFIYKIFPKYVIYLAEGLYENRYVTFTGDPEIIKHCEEFLSQITDIYSNQAKDFDNPESINFQIASGIHSGILSICSNKQEEIKKNNDIEIENINKAKQTLMNAKNKVINWRIKKDRLEYLLSSFNTFIPLLFVIILFAIAPELSEGKIIDLLFLLNIPNDFLLAIIFSALGGFLSAAIKSTQIQVTQDVDLKQTATVRIYIAIVSGILIYAIIRANYIPDLTGILNNNVDQNNWRIATISAIAGFIEYFIPNLLTPKNNNNETNVNN